MQPHPEQSLLIVGPQATWLDSWSALSAGAHLGDLWVAPNWEKGIRMEDLTSLRHFCGQRGVGNQGKWVALPHADLFSREVANALLKLIEEPPKGLRVVLFAEHADVLPTIRSRVAVRVIAGLSGGSRHDDLRALASQLDPLRNPAQARAFCYAAPMIHAQVSLDLIRDAFQS